MNKIVFFLFACLFSIAHGENLVAPLGFAWGDTKDNLSDTGILFEVCEAQANNVTACETKIAPKPVSFGDTYVLVFESKIGLQKIFILGKSIDSDITGQNGKNLYNEIKQVLIKKYGKPKTYERVGREVYKEYDEFYQCLKYDGCGSWDSLWLPSEGGVVMLSLRGSSRGKGFITLTYESKNWGKILSDINKEKNNSDSSAL